ncbi:MAG: large subunit ribosomal protein [Chloroflexota bacterium]|jgi:large subunit ribosomal protein L29|nr:large subunit ribosomal protein [Chloroflexota bacterium]
MKTALHLSELRTLEIHDLNDKLKEARTELFNLRFQAATGQLENHRQIRAVRRKIAQVLTVLQGRSMGFEELVVQSSGPATPARERKARRRKTEEIPVETPAAEAESGEETK